MNLIVPADERFRNLAPEVVGRYVAAVGGSESDASTLVGALTEAIGVLTAGPLADDAGLELDFRSPGNAVEITVRCGEKSSVVTHPLTAARV
ncbi:MAG: hypothetical protein EXQ49_07805 [Acidobacteria bacterium]|nr:hypothetical protein [Acidobacteriota bacterium]